MADVVQNQGLRASSDYKLTSIFLLTSTGQSLDISNIMLELNLFEDIFSPCVTGDLTVGDAGDILSSFQIHGNEFLSMQLDKPTLDKPIQKVFRIYKVANRRLTTATLQNYTFHFCSEEMLLSAQLLVSKSYKGLPITTMVKDILQNKLKVSDKKMGGLFSESAGNFDLIVPKMAPLEAIQWLAPKSYTTQGNLFFFFENRDGFNFVSYEDLIALPSYATYQRNVKLDNDPSINMYGFNYFSVIEDFDIIKATRFGAYSATLLSLDIINRSFTATNYGYDVQKSAGLLNKQAPVNNFQNRLGLSLTQPKDNMVKYVVGIDTDPTQNPALREKWIPQTISRLGQINTFKAVMVIPGDVLVKAGMVVNVVLPKMEVQSQATTKDAMRSGAFLVSAVHHKFTLDTMATVVELLSDSVNTSLNGPASDAGLTKIKSL